jgi:photosystem II stability/assembly factor-like uncharacterized protein
MPSDVAATRPSARRPRPRGGVLALGLVLLVFAGAVVTALFSARRIVGAVPGKGGLLSVAATGSGFLVGTTTGAFASSDGRTWSPVQALAGPSPVAGDGERVLAVSGRALVATTDLRTVAPVATLPDVPTAVAAGPDGDAYVIARSGELFRVDAGGNAVRAGRPGPTSALGLAVVGTTPPVVYAAGLGTGLWRSDDGGGRWSRLLATPAQAILPGAGSPDRILLGTPGGLLVTRDGGRSWRLSALQVPVRGIALSGGRYYALGEDRLLLVSPDGERDWRPVAAGGR